MTQQLSLKAPPKILGALPHQYGILVTVACFMLPIPSPPPPPTARRALRARFLSSLSHYLGPAIVNTRHFLLRSFGHIVTQTVYLNLQGSVYI